MRPSKTSHCFLVKEREVRFSSNFDSGNLRSVTQTGAYEFLIESSHDTYEMPASNKSFFHFRVENYPIEEPIRLLIANLSLLECIKPERRSQYCPCYSYNGVDYCRMPEGTSHIKQNQQKLTLQIDFLLQKQVVYFAFSFPYSYERYLNMVRDLPESTSEVYVKKEVLCYSKNLHLVYMITITSYDRKTDGYDRIGCSTNGVILPEKHLDDHRVYFDKPVVLLSGRVHPGETTSSWALEGIVKFLLGDSQEADTLRRNFQIVIVPMLNPDGVYEGLYRLDTQGHNLNRYYLISDNRQPSIYSMKHLIKHYNATKRLLFYFDFHGHPSYKGSFLYGNAIDDIAYQAETELFGRIMSMKCNTFEEKYCIFDRQQMYSKDKYDMYTKEGCARVYAFKMANILHSYTVEMGFHGCTGFSPESGRNPATFVYEVEDYYREGIAVMLAVLEVSSLTKSSLDKKVLRKQIADEIHSREERFRKEQKNSSTKKKNVNEIIDKQYWQPIKNKYFTRSSFDSEARKTRRIVKSTQKRVGFRHSLLCSIETPQSQASSDCKQNEDAKGEKIRTEIAEFLQYQSTSKKSIPQQSKTGTKSKLFTSGARRLSNISQQHGTESKKQVKVSLEKAIQFNTQTKILSERESKRGEPSRKKKSDFFEDLMFNDLNLRKSFTETQSRSGYNFVSADRITPRVEELKDIFKSDAIKNTYFGVKAGKAYKKYSHYFN